MQGHIWGTYFILQNIPLLKQSQASNALLALGWGGRADNKESCVFLWKILLSTEPAAADVQFHLNFSHFQAAYNKVEGRFIIPKILWFIRKGLHK